MCMTIFQIINAAVTNETQICSNVALHADCLWVTMLFLKQRTL